jgi:hypothetical protein
MAAVVEFVAVKASRFTSFQHKSFDLSFFAPG